MKKFDFNKKYNKVLDGKVSYLNRAERFAVLAAINENVVKAAREVANNPAAIENVNIAAAKAARLQVIDNSVRNDADTKSNFTDSVLELVGNTVQVLTTYDKLTDAEKVRVLEDYVKEINEELKRTK